ncbi:RagB/SusD family nutrient uptake outer membrane protein [Chitinophagaceae bacterium LB-8]|uniref:RagB/SusD family nutrient uptake outer membrane protein n=1 Tax=Paraflavisolibacter caeni TaxID=2982496 RepID=A0A9X3BJP5_9BACT|nr:RagB/SusD family nutrient uptake outer membrane protein [Paraflavisolibacter caeni]MCU7551498.1 RagB/SusD family nutrient uptake outer membrane protein [Paraflavisolibacter caeni]
MKKNILIIGLLALLSAGFLSCKKFLERDPLSQYTDQDLGSTDTVKYTTAGQAEALLQSAYQDFKNEYFMLDNFVNGDAQSDNAYAGADQVPNFQIDEFRIDATNSNVSRDWADIYSQVAKANTVITNVPRITDPALTQERKDQIVGEASFIRAYCYFDLVRLWGDVPLVLEEISSISASNIEQVYPKLYPSRSPKADVYAQIIADLQTTIAKAPASGSTKFIGTKGAAHALLAKVYATIEPHDWTKVNEQADAVIAAGYSLLPQYDQLWDNAHENSSEAIFEIDCIDWNTGGNWGTDMVKGTDWKKFNTPTNDLVNAFNAEGDNIRKNASIVFEDVTGLWTDRYWPATTFPFINKYRDHSGGQNFILIRLADILLLKAEALTELNDLTGAKALLNQVRNRAKLGNTTANTQADLRLAIEKERRLELAFEGHRWYDLVRTGRAIPVMNAQKDGNGASLGYNLTENKLIWPIPQSERDKNTNLTQNPGY